MNGYKIVLFYRSKFMIVQRKIKSAGKNAKAVVMPRFPWQLYHGLVQKHGTFCIPLAKFQGRIFVFKYLPKETLIHNARLIPIWNKSAEFKLSADSKHCQSYFGRKHRNVWFRTLSSRAILVFPAQFLLNQTKRDFKGYAIINLLSLA